MKSKNLGRRQKIKFRVSKVVRGTVDRPRLSVFRSNKEIYAQIIDDKNHRTLVAASSREKDFDGQGNKSEKSKRVGELLAERAVEKGIDKVAFDRNGYLYHGRVENLANGAREKGLKF